MRGAGSTASSSIDTWHRARTKSTMAAPSSWVEPVNTRSTATTTDWLEVSVRLSR